MIHSNIEVYVMIAINGRSESKTVLVVITAINRSMHNGVFDAQLYACGVI